MRWPMASWRNGYTLINRAVIPLLYVALSALALGWTHTSVNPWHTTAHARTIRELGDPEDEHLNCTPRSVDNFFGNFMSLEETQNGGVAAHIFISLYLIGALALICDDYFVVSLERICEDLRIDSDVAGATFMAAGSSAAEFFTSVIGVFIAKSDVGVGTIVGSAVFNLLVITGVCGIFAGVVVQLTWYPVCRDSFFYLLSVLALVLVIQDGHVMWYEALSLFLMCLLYFTVLGFNRRLEGVAQRLVSRCSSCCVGSPDDEEAKTPLLQSRSGSGCDTEVETSFSEVESRATETESLPTGDDREQEQEPVSSEASNKSLPNHPSPWRFPETFLKRVFWVMMLPIKVLLYLTVPDCRRRRSWRKLYLLTFLMSVIWIALFSYVLVWMVTIAGDALEIPDTVMGLTLLSAGTSVPDCLASLYVARDGLGDMAVSNAIASNVFNILMCLGLPWLLDTSIVRRGEHVAISSGGLLYDCIILLAAVVVLITALCVNRWKLNVKFGVFCIFSYGLVIGVSCLVEMNVFGELNLPSCPR